MTRKVLIAAVEPSADQMGAALYKALQERLPDDTEFMGCGGREMEKAGFQSSFPIDAFSVMGLTDALKVLPEALKRGKELAEMCAERQVDAAIFIDAWAFSRICAKRIRDKAPATKIIKYAGPQIWASRPERITAVKQYFDAVLTLFPFEPKYYIAHGIEAEFVGNQNYQDTVAELRKLPEKAGAEDGAKNLLVLPGSRKAEVRQLAPVFTSVLERLFEKHPDLKVSMPVAPAVSDMVTEAFASLKDRIDFVPSEERFAAFKQADVALAASGTVTTELAISRTPMVVVYKIDALSFSWLSRVATTEYVSILNIAADREILPEFIQKDCEAELILPAVEELLTDSQARQKQINAFDALLDDLEVDGAPAAQKAADAILKFLP